MVVVGNSTMRDLFFRQNVYSIGQTPYQSMTEIEMAEGRRDDDQPDAERAAESAANSSEGAGVRRSDYQRPRGRGCGGSMLAVDLAHEERLVAMMDIGTNTELIVGNKDRILAASCPAGPAFEGGAIACGMPALDGAIEEVAIAEDGGFSACA